MIDAIARTIGKDPGGYLGVEGRDDVAKVPAKGKAVVFKVDMLVEGTDVPRGMGFRRAARKAVAMCVSDFAAKGVRPDSFMASVGLKRGVTQEEVEQLGRGFRDAQDEWGVKMVGGDTNEAEELVIDCAMIGFADRIVARRGARPGDLLVVSGLFGLPPAGLRIVAGGAVASDRFRRKAMRSVLEPSPNLAAGLALGGYLTSAMDSSDGLARSIYTLARDSRVGFELDVLPAAEGVGSFAKRNRLSLERLVMVGGEEYVIVGTVSPKVFPVALKAAVDAGGELHAIGRADGEVGRVRLSDGGGSRPVRDEGWTHLG